MKNIKQDLPADRLWQPVTGKWFLAVFGSSLLYAIIRYHIAGDVAWSHFPLFILNKATSLAAVIFVACSYLIGKIIHWHDDDKSLRLVVIKFCGLIGFFMAAIHAFFSLSILTPAYFAKFFDAGGKLNIQGELGILVGVLGLFFLLSPAITTLPMMPKALGGQRWKRTQRLGYVSLIFVALHMIALGLKGWMAPAGWNAGLPPISLIAFLVILVPLIVKRRMILEKRERQTEAPTGKPNFRSQEAQDENR